MPRKGDVSVWLSQSFPVSHFPRKLFSLFFCFLLLFCKGKKARKEGYFFHESKHVFPTASFSKLNATDLNQSSRRKGKKVWCSAVSTQAWWPFQWRAPDPAHLLVLSPARWSLLCDKDKASSPLPPSRSLSLLSWDSAPTPAVPGAHPITSPPATGSPLRRALSWALMFRVKKKFKAVEWW